MRIDKRLITVFIIFCLLFLPGIAFYAENINEARVHQHLTAQSVLETVNDEDKFSTYLPLIEINTAKDTNIADIKIFDGDNGNNMLTNDASISQNAILRKGEIHDETLTDLISYQFNFIDSENNENNVDLMGMGAHSEWVLRGPLKDERLIMDYVQFNVAGEIMEESPDVRFCEVFEDGEYKGIYLAMESISVGEDRIDITPYGGVGGASSYILELDTYSPVETELDTYSSYNKKIFLDSGIQIFYPLQAYENEEHYNFIEDDFMIFEKNMFSYDFSDHEKGYNQYIDTKSFVDYFVVNEFFYNEKAGFSSTYIYKDFYGKLNIAPIWDFGKTATSEHAKAVGGFSLVKFDQTWYFMLLKDMPFAEFIIDRYEILSEDILNKDYVNNYIDETVLFLTPLLERNGINVEDEIKECKKYVAMRSGWLDNNIDIVKRFAHETKAKEYHH